MKHKVETREDGTVVALDGDVDLQSSPRARKALLDAVGLGRGTVVDLSGVSYIDSSGIAALVEAYQRSRRDGLRFVLAAVSDPTLRVLRLARLDRVFSIEPTVEAALSGE